MPGVVGICTNKKGLVNNESFKKMCESIKYKPWHIISNNYTDEDFDCASVQGYIGNIVYYEDKDSGVSIWLDGDILAISKDQQKIDANNVINVLQQITKSVQENNLIEMLSCLSGIFSLTIYDNKKGKVYLCTDRHGLRHMYYYNDTNGLIFSSEQKSIILSPIYNGSIRKESINTFMRKGYLEENYSWFENVYLIPPSSVIEWDKHDNKIDITKYSSPNKTSKIDNETSFNNIVYQLGEKFVNAVSLNIRQNEKIGIGLSGGLDSRALLAACDEIGVTTLAFTFGNKNSEEISIAKKVTKVANIQHKIFEIEPNNWLNGRSDAIIRAEGVPGFENLHNANSLEELHDLIDVKLDGFLGDATIGGSYLNYHSESELEMIENRGRRRIISGPKREMSFFNVRLPFFENEFYELAMSIPEDLRRNSYIYRCMLLDRFPKYFKSIPVLATGLPINNKNVTSTMSLIWTKFFRRLYLKAKRKNIQMANYQEYLRVEPGLSFVKNLLFTPDAEHKNYIDSELVISKFERHLKGENNLEYLGKVITLELWLKYIKSDLV